MITPTLTDWQAQLGSLLIGDGTPYEFVELAGLDELPDITSTDSARPTAHGDFQGDDYAGGRTITMKLEVAAEPTLGVTYAAAKAALRAVMVPTGRELVPFWFKLPDRPQLRASVKVRRHRLETNVIYEAGVAESEVQLRAPDPVLYGAPGLLSTGFAVQIAGLRYPLFTDRTIRRGMLVYGARSTAGRLLLVNEGTAVVYPVFAARGPVPSQGFAIVRVGTGGQVRFVDDIPAGSSLVMDSATGTAVIDGVADRGDSITQRDWPDFWIPAGGSIEIEFVRLGADTAATLEVSVTPGWW